MTTFVYRNGQLVDKNYAPPKNTLLRKVAGVISDTMSETRHMADGKMYTSKAKFREATKAAGCIEIGTETQTLLNQRSPIVLDTAKRREDIKRAIYELRNK